MSHPLRKASQRARSRPFFLASALDTYRESLGLDEIGLAAYLGCDPEDLPLLALCRRPAGEPAELRSDASRIGARFGLQAQRLIELLRLVDALEALQSGAQAGVLARGLLAAARDQDAEPPRAQMDADTAGPEDAP